MRKIGNEFGSTTGRPRRCGWLDLPALRYAITINGVTQLLMMKGDVLSDFETLKICTHYKYNGKVIDYLPYDISPEHLEPVYKEMKGWNTDLTTLTKDGQLPDELNSYIHFIEKEVGVPITVVSVGPDRTQTILRNKVLA
jgi:adenylosuccinate synthase